MRVHRIAWSLKHGNPSNELCVLHKCDNPPCCNTEHLFLGTRADNNADRDKKGRGYWQRPSSMAIGAHRKPQIERRERLHTIPLQGGKVEALDKYITKEIMGKCWHDWDEDEYKCRKCGIECVVISPGYLGQRPKYTTDLNLAFEAAEKFGLLEELKGSGWLTKAAIGMWWVVQYPKRDGKAIIAEHENPATCICLAIYRLKTGKNWE